MPKKDEKKKRPRKLHSVEKATIHHSKKTFFDYPPNTMLIVPNSDSHHNGLYGSGFNLGRSIKGAFKHVGHVLQPIAKSVGNEVKNVAKNVANKSINAAKNELGQQLMNSGSKLLPSLESAAPELAEGALVAAGKKKRRVSPKMAKRRALVKKLMKEKHLTLPQASSYIKQHNLI
jgi:hypothetical protein